MKHAVMQAKGARPCLPRAGLQVCRRHPLPHHRCGPSVRATLKLRTSPSLCEVCVVRSTFSLCFLHGSGLLGQLGTKSHGIAIEQLFNFESRVPERDAAKSQALHRDKGVHAGLTSSVKREELVGPSMQHTKLCVELNVQYWIFAHLAFK